jgi:hypothetical protein
MPREIRRQLNLFIGQTLNFSVDDHFCISIATGVLPSAEEAEFYKLLKGEKPRFPKGKKFRKSDARRQPKIERLRSARFAKLERMMAVFPVDPDLISALDDAREAESARLDLRQLVANMSRFLLKVQERL